MDAKIENRDISIDNIGNYKMIDGFDEIIQQVIINISASKGKFIYDRNLGSYCRDCKDINDLKTIEMLVNESLVNMYDVYVKVTKTQKLSNGLKLFLNISYKELSADKEVIIYDYI
ncbi:MAG: hypothetical protein J1E56_01220 [Ruminococcus sp.]|nr:hypothetical protein [Ruminococcus sp.]